MDGLQGDGQRTQGGWEGPPEREPGGDYGAPRQEPQSASKGIKCVICMDVIKSSGDGEHDVRPRVLLRLHKGSTESHAAAVPAVQGSPSGRRRYIGCTCRL